MPRVAVIGCGSVSVVHFEAIKAIPGAELVAVCDSDAATLEAAAAQHGVPGFADHQALLDQVRPDVVHISTPHDQHVPVALDSLAAGVAVLMEKPVARTVDEAQALIAAAEASPAKIGICFQNRYNATAQAIRTLLDSGQLGAVLGGSASVTWNRPASYYADPALAGAAEAQRRRRDDQSGDPHPRRAALVAGGRDRGRRAQQPPCAGW